MNKQKWLQLALIVVDIVLAIKERREQKDNQDC